MIIQNTEGQLLSPESLFGVQLRDALIEHGIENIDSGTVLVARFNRYFYLFEVSCPFNVKKLKGASLMYPLAGSRLFTSAAGEGMLERMLTKTTLFRDCRLPTESEYLKYIYTATV